MTGQSLNVGVIALFAIWFATHFQRVDGAELGDVLKMLERHEAQRDVIAHDLIRIVSDPNQLAIDRQIAATALGKFRSHAAIFALVENLLVRATSFSEIHATRRYPAATAIREIGSAAYPLIWDRLNHECSAEYLHVLGLTITGFDGKAITIIRVKERLSSPRISQQQRANLEALLRLLETVDFDDLTNWRF